MSSQENRLFTAHSSSNTIHILREATPPLSASIQRDGKIKRVTVSGQGKDSSTVTGTKTDRVAVSLAVKRLLNEGNGEKFDFGEPDARGVFPIGERTGYEISMRGVFKRRAEVWKPISGQRLEMIGELSFWRGLNKDRNARNAANAVLSALISDGRGGFSFDEQTAERNLTTLRRGGQLSSRISASAPVRSLVATGR